MPVKWTPVHLQILFWLAWSKNKVEVQQVLDAWPTIPGEDPPTFRAVSDRVGIVRKRIEKHGLAEFFGAGPTASIRSNHQPRSHFGEAKQGSPEVKVLKKEADVKPVANGGGPLRDQTDIVKQETNQRDVAPPRTMKTEDPNDTITVAAENSSPDPNVIVSTNRHTNPQTQLSRQNQKTAHYYLDRWTDRSGSLEPTSSIAWPGQPHTNASTAKANNARKRRRMSDSSISEVDYADVLVKADSDESDGAWRPTADEKNARKRLRR